MFSTMPSRLLLLAIVSAASAVWAENVPQTLMTTRGKLLASEDFTAPLAPATGTPKGFASGFSGWRFNTNPKAGKWEQGDGIFKGMEIAESHHPATASYGIKLKDAIIQCDVRLDNVPAEGRPYRTVFLKLTDEKDYVCSLSVGPGGAFLTTYDPIKTHPKTHQRERCPAVKALQPVKLDAWHTLVLEVRGDEVVGTLDGRSVTASNALIGLEKHSVMIGAGTQGSFRNFRVWEALPNADWPKNKQALQANAKPSP